MLAAVVAASAAGAATAGQGIPLSHAVVLGITQGLSEFLPISSSGHLILVPWLFGWEELSGAANAEFNQTFDVALHMGTFVGATAYFARDLTALARGAWAGLRRRSARSEPTTRLAWLLAVSALPGAVVGGVFESAIAERLGQIWLIGVMLVVFGVVLLVADRVGRTERDVDGFRLRDALVMGLCQAGALQPGVSRSGITITAGRLLGFDRDAAARLSFLMSLPLIGGAGMFKAVDLVRAGLPPGTAGAFAVGILTSAVTGLLAVWLVLRLVRTRSFLPFVLYRLAAGAAVLTLVATGLR